MLSIMRANHSVAPSAIDARDSRVVSDRSCTDAACGCKLGVLLTVSVLSVDVIGCPCTGSRKPHR